MCSLRIEPVTNMSSSEKIFHYIYLEIFKQVLHNFWNILVVVTISYINENMYAVITTTHK